MRSYVITLLAEIDSELQKLQQSQENQIDFSKAAFKVYQARCSKLRTTILQHQFDSAESEIEFFKELKPKLEANSLFYRYIYKIESECRQASTDDKISTYTSKISKIRNYFKSNKSYYGYYKTGNDMADQYYFIRSNSIHSHLEFEHLDHNYSTGHDQYFIKIMAYEQLLEYLNERIIEYDKKHQLKVDLFTSEVVWTADEVDLIELIYALKEIRAIAHGDISLKKLISVFEMSLNVKIVNPYSRTFIDIKNRKNPCVFLEKCIDALTNKVERDL